MPTALTFTTLQEDVRQYIERGSATYDTAVYEQIPKWINLTERRIARELKVQGFIRSVTSQMVAAEPVLQKPDRWRETISINFGTNIGTATTYNQRTPLRELAYEALILYWPNRATTGVPRFYADYDYQHWIVGPSPAEAYPFECMFWELPPLLDMANQTNYLTENAPNALLNGTLDQAYSFLKNDAEKAKYKAEYDRDMAALSGEDLQKILDRYYKRNTS
jgi:hypothetical protein